MIGRTDGRSDHRISMPLKLALLISAQVLLLAGSLMLAVADDPPGAKSIPNDPMLAEQWYLYPPGDERGSPGSINAIEAWRHVRPAEPIVVAVLDAGVNYIHPDLAANMWKNEREMPNGKDDDGNGYVDDLH